MNARPDSPRRASQDVASLRPGEEKKAPRSALQRAEAETIMFASARALPLEYAEPFVPPEDPRQAFGARVRSTRFCRIALGLVLLLQAALTLRMHNTAFEDEALYLYAGHLEIARLLHGTAVGGSFPGYFSGAPVLYPVLGAAADSLGGLTAARAVSLLAMLGTTALLYGLTRRLFNDRIALYAAMVFAVTESTLFLGNLATYDATALFLLALAAWLVVWSAERRLPLYLLAAPVLTLAVATKYAALLWVPCAIALAAFAAWPRRGGRAAALTAILLAAATALLLAGVVRVAGPDYWRGITSTTLQRAASDSSPGTVLWNCVQWIGLPVLLAVIGTVAHTFRPATETGAFAASAGGRARRAIMGIVLTGSALLAPANQMRIDTLVSLHKHVGFGLLFAAPIAGIGLAWLIGDHFRRMQVGIAVWGAALALGMTQANDLFNGWPDSSVSVAEIARYLHPGAHYLDEVPQVPIYYLRDRPDAQPGQFTSPFSFTFGGQSGAAAFAAAIKDGYFSVVAFDYTDTAAMDPAIAHALAINADYRLAVIVPESTGNQEYIWVRNG